MTFEETVELLKHGPLTLLATCREAAEIVDDGARENRVSIDVASSVDGWDMTTVTVLACSPPLREPRSCSP